MSGGHRDQLLFKNDKNNNYKINRLQQKKKPRQKKNTTKKNTKINKRTRSKST